MNIPTATSAKTDPSRAGWWLLLAALMLTTAIYSMGLSGAYLFDDYPNIVDNQSVQPHDASMPSLVRAALSSPASDFKRPLASLSFAANYLASGLDPYWMKLTNLAIHLLNGLLVFLLTRVLLQAVAHERTHALGAVSAASAFANKEYGSGSASEEPSVVAKAAPTRTEIPSDAESPRTYVVAALVAAGWMLLPINLTGVLYVVQRMESMANLFVLLGLIGYVAGRNRMLGLTVNSCSTSSPTYKKWRGVGRSTTSNMGFIVCLLSITIPTTVGILAKETAVMLPLYALLIEWILFGFQHPLATTTTLASEPKPALRHDYRIITLFLLVLALPMVAGLAWLLPGIFNPAVWAARDFTLTTRLFSEARIIVDYILWTLLPTPNALSFYHDNFHISSGLLTPWTTLASIVFLGTLVVLLIWLRQRQPLAALGIALFLGCQLLTGTILPLELIYEHRNYFASFGLLLAIIPLLAAPPISPTKKASSSIAISQSTEATPHAQTRTIATEATSRRALVGASAALPMALPRYALLAGLTLCWASLTAITAHAWGSPLRLAEDLASRAPQSPRAQYELGRTYIIYSHYDPSSPFTQLAYAPLERSAALPKSSILAEQALIFMNARMHQPLKNVWWDSMIAKLKAHKPGVQDESSLSALTQCVREQHCDLPTDRMMEVFMAALSHPDPSARMLATYGDYAWNVLNDHDLGERMIKEAVRTSPDEPAYQITLIRMLAAQDRNTDARAALDRLQALNIGGRLNQTLAELHDLPGLR